jgi:putative membrane protein
MKLIQIIGASATVAMMACGSNNSTSGADSATAVPADTSSKMAPSTAAEQDFINYAVPGNTKEIIWLKAGIHEGHNKDLKKDAKMMLKDHLQLDSTVSAYLNMHKNFSVPVVDTTNAVNINDKKGTDWDKAWADKMIDDHTDLLGKLQKSQSDVKDTALLAIINGVVPVVQSHLSMAKDMKAKLH